MNEAEIRIDELKKLKADIEKELCFKRDCEKCSFYDDHYYCKSGCGVDDFIDAHIMAIERGSDADRG